ncbi:hypothetical protein ACHAXS_000112, partial [Conticribra weissflogii]
TPPSPSSALVTTSAPTLPSPSQLDPFPRHIRITTAGNKRCMFANKESSEGTAPHLMVLYQDEQERELVYFVPAAANAGGLVSNLSSQRSKGAALTLSLVEPIVPRQFLFLRATDDGTIDPKSPTSGVNPSSSSYLPSKMLSTCPTSLPPTSSSTLIAPK